MIFFGINSVAVADALASVASDMVSVAPDAAHQPVLSADPAWAGVMLILAGGLFLASVTVGIVSMLVSEESMSRPED